MIDLYCERLGPGLFAEPVNAITNLVFFVAAWGAWRLARKHRTLTAEIWLLIGFILFVGIGSGLFHSFATSWARILDVLSIFLFQLAYLWSYFRRIGGIHPVYASGLVFGFLVVALWARQFPHLLNGSLSYAPALMVVIALGAYHYLTHRNERPLLLIVAAAFFVSLFFRTIDSAVCPYFSLGTHFLWHLLNALLLFLLMKALLANIKHGPTAGNT